MLYQCNSLTSLELGNYFDLARANSLSSMFYNCTLLTSLDVSRFKTSEMTMMSSAFALCSSLTSLDVFWI